LAERRPGGPAGRNRYKPPSRSADGSGEGPWPRARKSAAEPRGRPDRRLSDRGRDHGHSNGGDDRRARTGPKGPPGADARAAAALAIHRVRDRGQSLSRVLERSVRSGPPADRALTQELVYGTLRVLPRLEALAGNLLHHPVKPADRDLEALILVGLYQLTTLGTPEHAAVAATVDAVRLLGKPEKAPLVNALLRRFLRERETLLAAIEPLPSARWLFPEWLLTTLRRDWPEDWEALITASNERPPMSLRVNTLHNDRRTYAGLLAAAGITARPLPGTEAGLILDHPVPVETLPGFATGLVSVQDGGAQFAAQILDARSGQRVLDACAAPGGKTAHLIERAGPAGLDLVAIDSAPARLTTLRENLDRLGLSARIVHADAANPFGDWTRPPFERVLLDVPCSATGVIRRHPDIKWLRRPTDIPQLCELQARILDAIWPLLASGGRLLYVTCSVLAAENQDQIAAFLARQPTAREVPIGTDWGRARIHGRQLLPSSGGTDGFYYALLEKPAS
jgi:16S rRNA (cytosine967-C5)-methyltransferase